MAARASRYQSVKFPGREIEFHRVQAIQVREGRRAINEDAARRLMESMKGIGLKTSISIRYYEDWPSFLGPVEKPSDALVLLTGAHRLEAAKRLGWEEIECICYNTSTDLEAELWEISENLHRAELTALERDRQVARWIELTKEQQEVSRQLDVKPQGGRPEGGTRAASRELGISEPDARRAVQVASLSVEAQQTARDTGLDNNGTVLLQAAKQEGPEAQVHYLQTESQKREERPKIHAERIEAEFARMMKASGAGTTQSRRKFYRHIHGSREFNLVALSCPPELDAAESRAGV